MKNIQIETWQRTIIDNSNHSLIDEISNEELIGFLWCKEWANLMNWTGINGTQIFASVHQEKPDLKPFGIQISDASRIFVLIITKGEYSNSLPFIVGIDSERHENGHFDFIISYTSRCMKTTSSISDPYLWREASTTDLKISDKSTFLNELTHCFHEYLEWVYANILNKQRS